ncbi:MAG TPA: DUF5610 domain-containing protein, partial [bacterium]|nr:DUF5610 domain-containing protein [bacterium]
MNAAAIGYSNDRAIQSYSLSGRLEYQSYEYAKVSRTNGASGLTDIVELGRGEKVSIEFTLSMVQERTQSKIAARLPEAPSTPGLPSFQGLDTSPEATAQRIVDFATAFLGAYKEQHPELGDVEALEEFMELIRGAIDEGFAQAKDIIDSLNALTPELNQTI